VKLTAVVLFGSIVVADRARLKEIASLSSFGILLVVFGHSYANLNIDGDGYMRFMYFVRRVIYGFHMPLFMFVSGYLFVHTTQGMERIGCAGFIRKKFVRLLVPYLILSAAAFGEKAAFAGVAWRNTEVSFRTFLFGLVYPLSNMNTYFWFLPTIFLIFLAAPVIHTLVRRRRRLLLVALATAGLAALNILNPFDHTQILNLSGVARQFVYFWLGSVFYVYMPRGLNVSARAAITAVSFGALLALSLYADTAGRSASISFAAAVCGIFFSYFLIGLCSGLKLNLFSPINGYSYQIYLLSWFFQTAVRITLYEVNGLGFPVSFLAMFAAGLAGPVLVAKAVGRYLPRAGFAIGMQAARGTGGTSFRRRASLAPVFSSSAK